MSPSRVILDPAAPADSSFSDPSETLSRAEFAGRVAAVAEALAELPPQRLCLPVTSDLGALAVLVAALESAHSVALLPGPLQGEDDVPGFASAVVTAGTDSPCAIRPTGTAPVADAADRIYLRSSGSTGTPKWAAHETDRLLANGQGVIARLGLAAADRVMLPVPVHHMYGLGAGLLPSLMAGASVHLVPRGNPLTIFAAQRGFQPDVMFLVPSQCRSIMALGRKAGRARLVVVAGDKLGADEAAAFEAEHGRLVNLYGSTELGAITAGHPDDPPELRHPFAGPPIDGFALALEPCEDPEAAEGAMMMRLRHRDGLLGYAWPETGELKAPAGDFWTTGDLVRRHAEDRIEVLGRADFAVNRDGLLVHMGDIEACLSRVPGVAQAAVVSAGMTRRGVGLTAFCAAGDGAALSEEAVLERIRAALPARAVPDRLVVMEALPLLPSGKYDRRALTAAAERHLDR
jgi:acyl-coenzyme A synthetase/AMP-(fatty) acid ligase